MRRRPTSTGNGDRRAPRARSPLHRHRSRSARSFAFPPKSAGRSTGAWGRRSRSPSGRRPPATHHLLGHQVRLGHALHVGGGDGAGCGRGRSASTPGRGCVYSSRAKTPTVWAFERELAREGLAIRLFLMVVELLVGDRRLAHLLISSQHQLRPRRRRCGSSTGRPRGSVPGSRRPRQSAGARRVGEALVRSAPSW